MKTLGLGWVCLQLGISLNPADGNASELTEPLPSSLLEKHKAAGNTSRSS